MRLSTLALASACASVSLLFFSSCSKGRFLEPPEIVNGCPITSFSTFLEGGTPSPPLTFQYNKAGQLLTITPGTTVINDLLDYHFRYDAFGRISDYIITGAGFTGAFIWHRYSYPDARMIVDSSYDYVGDIDGPPPTTSFDISVDFLPLDNEDRVIADSTGPGGVTHYQYDMEGNLVRPGVTYDHKINFLRTNYLLMLILRDFSRNNPLFGYIYPFNPVQITGYNAAGLPEELICTLDYFEGFIFEFTTLKITYSCDQKKSGL
jgi:hypothetical protein